MAAISTAHQAVVITSIFAPTRAVRAFARFSGSPLIVVGDRKTPADWSCRNVRFISAAEQERLPYHISNQLPWNHYARKMIGYLAAVEAGADTIADTDDDNIPKKSWGFPPFEGVYRLLPPDLGFFNVYRYFGSEKQPIWPRGFPLTLIRPALENSAAPPAARQAMKVGIWQGLVDGSPDVDAVYRMVINQPFFFRRRAPVVLDRGTICPVNSQNTAFCRKVFALLYLPAFVNFRFTDILRGLVAQPILWRLGLRIGFTRATVIQQRNLHDDLKDFASEIPVYLHAREIVAQVDAALSAGAGLADHLCAAYERLHRRRIVPAEELKLLEAWLKDLQQMGHSV